MGPLIEAYELIFSILCFSAGLGVLNVAVQAAKRISKTERNPQFFLLDKDVRISLYSFSLLSLLFAFAAHFILAFIPKVFCSVTVLYQDAICLIHNFLESYLIFMGQLSFQVFFILYIISKSDFLALLHHS